MIKITKIGTVPNLCPNPKVNNAKEKVYDNIPLAIAEVGVLVGLGHPGKQ